MGPERPVLMWVKCPSLRAMVSFARTQTREIDIAPNKPTKKNPGIFISTVRLVYARGVYQTELLREAQILTSSLKDALDKAA